MSLSLLLSSAIEPLPCLVERVFLAASTDHYSQAQLVSRRKDCCCRKPSLEGAEVSPSAVQELIGVSGCRHWSSCDPAHLCGGVAGFVSLMDPPPKSAWAVVTVPLGAGGRIGSCWVRTPFMQACRSKKRTQLCNTNVLMKPQRRNRG